MTELDVLIKQLDEKLEQLKEATATGTFETFEEYKRICGEIRGLLIARGYVLDMKDRVEDND
jgi:uncharacterized protein YaaR (DUF327 family)